MGYLVYEMEAIQELRGEDRRRVQEIKNRLMSESVSRSGYIPIFEPLGRGYFKKRLEKKRLLAYRLDVPFGDGWVPVVVLLELFDRKDPSYGDGTAEYFAQRFGKLLERSEPEIISWAHQQLTQVRRGTLVSLPPLPPELEIVHKPLVPRGKAEAIFHSRLFAQTFRNLDRSRWADLYDALEGIVQKVEDGEVPDLEILEDTKQGFTITYCVIKDPLSEVSNIFLLGFTASHMDGQEVADLKEQIQRLGSKLEENVIFPLIESMETLRDEGLGSCHGADSADNPINRMSQLSAHAYPTFMAWDRSKWLEMMERREVLLPLSSEEQLGLERLLQGSCFPAIIEGRAGSGKTTLLTFFVPQRIHLTPHMEDQVSTGELKVLYLTQSKPLLENAQKVVAQLLEQLKKEKYCPRTQALLSPSFLTFHRFALEQLSPERRIRFRDRSPEGGWIDFNRFRALLRDPKWGLRERLSRDVQNPEVTWFVLRSYIKGFKLAEDEEDRWMTPEEYESGDEISKKDRQVSLDVFQEVWEKVWPWYKRLTIPCPENNSTPRFWDDIDLAREVLLHRWQSAPRYAVIVCDEVQDLTRIELAAVLQSLEQLQYRIRPEQVSQIPVIMAGDSHQTINPACFRWERLKADCAKALVRHIPHAPLLRIEPIQLQFNYRNRPSIAKLCNAIQVFRQEVLGVQSELQKIWVPEDSPYNQAVKRLIVEPGSDVLKQLFREGVHLVGPEPADAADELGKEFWRRLGLPDGPPERLSYETPADLKGLEREYLALLGFGTAFQLLGFGARGIWNRFSDRSLSEREQFALEYFLNRLYVAASRAREELWIVETQEGWDAFWKPLQQWVDDYKALSSASATPAHSPQSGGNGKEERFFEVAWAEGRANECQAVFRQQFGRAAKEYLERAKDTGNPEDAERAACYYSRDNDHISRKVAEAWHLYLRGEKSQAAERMWEVDRKQASDWWWEAANWQQLAEREVEPGWRRELARRMCQPPSERQLTWVLQTAALVHQQRADLDRQTSPRMWQTWSHILTELLEAALTVNLPPRELQSILELAHPYENEPHKDPTRFHKALAQLWFSLENYSEAVRHWERAEWTDHRDYFLAKARTTSFPENLKWYESAQDWDAIVREDELNRDKQISREDSRRIYRACVEKGRLGRAVQLAASFDEREFARRWADFVEDTSITESDLRELIERAYQALANTVRTDSTFANTPEAPADEPDKQWLQIAEINRRWSRVMLEALRFIHENRTRFERSPRARTWYPVLHGFSLGNDPDAVANHFRSTWQKRSERPEDWDQSAGLLAGIVNFALEVLGEKWTLHEVNAVAHLTHLVLGLVWGPVYDESGERRKRTIHDPDLDADFDLLAPRPYLANPSFGGEASFKPSDFAEEFLAVARKALQTVAMAPPDVLRGAVGSIHRNFRDLLDGIGYGFWKQVASAAAPGQTPPTPEQEDWWELAGRFVRRVPFRRLAIAYFEALQKVSETLGVSVQFERYISQGMQEARRDLAKLREEREVIHVEPGQSKEKRELHVRSLAAIPEIIVEFLPRYEQFRLSFDPETRQLKLGRLPEGYRWDRQERSGHAYSFVMRSPDEEVYKIVWQKGDHKVRIIGDVTFEVIFALPHQSWD